MRPWLVLFLSSLSLLEAFSIEFVRAALVAKGNLYLGGNILVDSFDSSDPNQSTNGDYTPYSRKAGGNVIANENQDGSLLSLQNTVEVFGKAYVGPNGTVLMGTNSSLGSTTWRDAGNVGIEPGWLNEDPMVFALDPATVPFTNGLPLPAKGTRMLMGTNYVNSYLLTSGNYQHTQT